MGPPHPRASSPREKLYRWDNRLVRVADGEILSVGNRQDRIRGGLAKLPKGLRAEAENIAYGTVRGDS
jgi:hypothetical protein